VSDGGDDGDPNCPRVRDPKTFTILPGKDAKTGWIICDKWSSEWKPFPSTLEDRGIFTKSTWPRRPAGFTYGRGLRSSGT